MNRNEIQGQEPGLRLKAGSPTGNPGMGVEEPDWHTSPVSPPTPAVSSMDGGGLGLRQPPT